MEPRRHVTPLREILRRRKHHKSRPYDWGAPDFRVFELVDDDALARKDER